MHFLPLIFLLFCSVSSVTFRYRILKTPIFHFTDVIKEHHIVFVESMYIKHGIYVVDFTPIRQNSWKTLVYLFLGMNVPAEIRVRFIRQPHIDFNQTTDAVLQESWSKESVLVDPPTLFYPVDLFKHTHKKWKEPHFMNLYTHNCQHFRHDFTQLLEKFV